MKNQYFGDVNDYKKYGLLRVLSGMGEISTGVCWLLTPSDGRTDGQKLRYLEQPDGWAHFDADLFSYLRQRVIVDGERDVRLIENSEVLPRTYFYSPLLGDKADERRVYFTEMQTLLRDAELIFFDPDNGLEVTSKLFGRKDSSKYLYWHELAETYAAGHSVLVYQHFGRENRKEFVYTKAERMRSETGAPSIYAFSTPHVVFLLAVRPEHLSYFGIRAESVTTVWGEKISVSQPLDD